MKLLKFILIRLIAFTVILYLFAMIYLYFNQESLIFRPSILAKDYKFRFNSDFEELNIPSFDKTNLNGLLFKTENAKGLVFYLHGNAGALDSWGDNAEIYNNLGYDFFVLDYRGYGKSDGKIENEEQFNKDIDAVYNFLKVRYSEDKISVIGYSIGSGPATILASKNNPKRLILQSPYYNFGELSSSKLPFVPNFIKRYKFETDKYISKVQAPIYIFHGENDALIPFENSVRLSKLYKKEDHLYILKNQEHNRINYNLEYQAQIKNILN